MSAIRNVMKNFARNAELDEYLRNEIADSGYGGVDVLKTPIGTRITIFVTRPGLVIGRRGVGIRSLTENIGEKFGLQNPQISVLEIEVPELNPQVMCNRIAHTVSRGTAFRRAALWSLNSIMNAGAMGAEISVSGKLRSERAHHEKYHAGVVPKSGDTAKRIVREATQDILLKMGLYGIKVKIAVKDSMPPEVEIMPTKLEKSQPSQEQAEDKHTKEQAEFKTPEVSVLSKVNTEERMEDKPQIKIDMDIGKEIEKNSVTNIIKEKFETNEKEESKNEGSED